MSLTEIRKKLAQNKLYSRLSEEKYCLMTRISPTWNSKVRWKQAFSRKLDLDHPEWYGEKLLALKLRYYNKSTFIQKVASKDRVADYVRYCGYGDTLKTCYGVWDSFDEIPFDALPDKFVLKTTTGCGSHAFCRDKRTFDREAARKTIAHAMQSRDHLLYSELQYRGKRRIMAEEFLDAPPGRLPDDIKIHCFHGVPTFTFICYDREESGRARVAVMDNDWQPIEGYMKAKFDLPGARPSRFDEMVEMAKTLSAPFPFVRVDFFLVNGRIVFGELTFTPGGGNQPLHTEASHIEIGKFLDMQKAAEQAKTWPALEKAVYGE